MSDKRDGVPDFIKSDLYKRYQGNFTWIRADGLPPLTERQRINRTRVVDALIKEGLRNLDRPISPNGPRLTRWRELSNQTREEILSDAARQKEELGAIARPPGRWMASFAKAVFSPKTRELVFDPIVGDYWHEYIEAVHDGASGTRLLFLHIRHWNAFWSSVLSRIVPLATMLRKIFRSS